MLPSLCGQDRQGQAEKLSFHQRSQTAPWGVKWRLLRLEAGRTNGETLESGGEGVWSKVVVVRMEWEVVAAAWGQVCVVAPD